MSLYILCIGSNLFLLDVFKFQPQILGDIGQTFCSLSQVVSNWSEVVPLIIIPSRLMQMDIVYLTNCSLDWLLILMTFIALNNSSCSFLFWD